MTEADEVAALEDVCVAVAARPGVVTENVCVVAVARPGVSREDFCAVAVARPGVSREDVCAVAIARPGVLRAYAAKTPSPPQYSFGLFAQIVWAKLSGWLVGSATILFPHMPCTLVSPCLLPMNWKPPTFITGLHLEVFRAQAARCALGEISDDIVGSDGLYVLGSKESRESVICAWNLEFGRVARE